MSDADRVARRYALLLGETRRIYGEGADACIASCSAELGQSPEQFRETMELLRQGLVVKTYVTVARADGRWSAQEQVLARVLIEHLWEQPLDGDALREAARKLFVDSDRLSWDDLIRPFRRLAPLRESVVRLETIILRMAHLIAKADRSMGRPEVGALREIEDVLHRLILPLDAEQASGGHEARAVPVARTSGAAPSSPPRTGSADSNAARDAASTEEELEATLAELDALIGLSQVKSEVRTLVNVLRMRRRREALGLPASDLSLHMVFRGNPGTGKTTVARLLARVFRAMGILAKGHLVETDRSGLVAEYAGQSGPKTQKVIDGALDGVLFVDEAYSLVAAEGDDPFGAEALQVLLKRMEDQRERLVVILAGYPRPMDELLATNPGLRSRFTQHLTFEDYAPDELGRIFEWLAGKLQYRIDGACRARLLQGFTWKYHRRDEHFGNGRYARNVLEHAIRQMANRLAQIDQPSKDLLAYFEPDDFRFPDVPAEWFVGRSELAVVVTCPNCRKTIEIPGTTLGEPLSCRHCTDRFEPAWGSIKETPA